jgi:hypothetical protein
LRAAPCRCCKSRTRPPPPRATPLFPQIKHSRRHPGGGGGGGGFDIEALQRDNDAGVDALAERVGLLKSATAGIRGEVEAQHSILDRMVRLHRWWLVVGAVLFLHAAVMMMMD